MNPIPLQVFLLMLAFLMFALAAGGLQMPRINMVALGLALCTLALLVRGWPQ